MLKKIPIKIAESPHQISNISDDLLDEYPTITDLDEEIQKLKISWMSFQKYSVKDLLYFFDSISAKWMKDEQGFLTKYGQFGITFLLNFMRSSNLEILLKSSIGNQIDILDQFIDSPILGKQLRAIPKGILIHWLAGNVPVLGMISLIQGLITKNCNIVKVPKTNGMILPSIIAELQNHHVETERGILDGKQILDLLLFVYCDRTDKDAQAQLSRSADVRIAWGGREAVESVLSLQKRYFTEDVIFGPKYSFAVIGKNSFTNDELNSLAYRLALDASVFDQQGCNSPHTLFYEKNGDIDGIKFAEALAKGMEKVLKRIPKDPISSQNAYQITNIRTESLFNGAKIWNSRGTEWTIIYSEEKGFADPCYSRVLFVRPVDNIYDIIPLIGHQHQSMGLSISPNRKQDFAQAAAFQGIERITEIGKMSVYDHPWDGLFPMNRFVKWVSLQ